MPRPFRHQLVVVPEAPSRRPVDPPPTLDAQQRPLPPDRVVLDRHRVIEPVLLILVALLGMVDDVLLLKEQLNLVLVLGHRCDGEIIENFRWK